jgi:antitoxin PrlF
MTAGQAPRPPPKNKTAHHRRARRLGLRHDQRIHQRRGRVTIVASVAMPWHDRDMDATVVLGKQGRLVIPAEVRAALGLAPGDRLHLRLAGQQLVLERPQDAAAELRALGSGIPRARSLVDELLAERRLAAAAE